MLYVPTYVPNPLVQQNVFRGGNYEKTPLPLYKQERHKLPKPYWQGRDDVIDCYWKAWELTFRNLKQPEPDSGFTANYIDTAFNGCIFFYDTTFILMFANYAKHVFPFQRTLDNFYAKQHADGFICRELTGLEGRDRFHRYDPSATGPNIMPWAEWEYYTATRDVERIRQVFPALVSFHRWFRKYRTWPNGAYWATGWSSGFDNHPRHMGNVTEEDELYHHGHLTWVDTCIQQIFTARILVRMAETIGREDEVGDMKYEIERLTAFVNENMWDDQSAFYYDLHPDQSRSTMKSVGAYWSLLADIVPESNMQRFIDHLENPAEFNRPHRIPALSADHPRYREDGDYWNGGVWTPTNYMVMKGLAANGFDRLAYEIGLNHLDNVVRVFNQTGTIWENYAPEIESPGTPARPDFVGWGGLPAIAVLMEYVFGIRPNVADNRIVWHVNLLEEHGVRQYPFDTDGFLDLNCAARTTADEKPIITATGNKAVEIEIKWQGGTEMLTVHGQ